MQLDRQLVIKARNRMILMWVFTPFIMFVSVLVMAYDGELKIQGAIWSLIISLPYVVLSGLFYWRVWKTPSDLRGQTNLRLICKMLAICILGFIGAQFVPSTPVHDWGISDALVPMWVLTTVRAWGFPFYIVNHLSPVTADHYGRVVIDYSSAQGNLLAGLFALFLFHCWLCAKWHKPIQEKASADQQSADDPRK